MGGDLLVKMTRLIAGCVLYETGGVRELCTEPGELHSEMTISVFPVMSNNDGIFAVRSYRSQVMVMLHFVRLGRVSAS